MGATATLLRTSACDTQSLHRVTLLTTPLAPTPSSTPETSATATLLRTSTYDIPSPRQLLLLPSHTAIRTRAACACLCSSRQDITDPSVAGATPRRRNATRAFPLLLLPSHSAIRTRAACACLCSSRQDITDPSVAGATPRRRNATRAFPLL